MLVDESEFEMERKVMVKDAPMEMATGTLKEVEQHIIDFYLKIAEKNKIDIKLTEIFAYFKIYNFLTQKQLKKLTGSSIGASGLSSIVPGLVVTISNCSLDQREFIKHSNCLK